MEPTSTSDGYAFVHIPTSAGSHELECVVWRPLGSWKDRLMGKLVGARVSEFIVTSLCTLASFLGISTQLKYPRSICDGNDRSRLQTESMGIVHLKLYIVHKGFDQYGIEW